jgi:hypothetical protein
VVNPDKRQNHQDDQYPAPVQWARFIAPLRQVNRRILDHLLASP